MKKTETHERIINIYFEPHEIDNLIKDKVSNLSGVGIAQNGVTFEIKYNFVEEGSPAYRTDKIKAHVKITHDLMETNKPSGK